MKTHLHFLDRPCSSFYLYLLVLWLSVASMASCTSWTEPVSLESSKTIVDPSPPKFSGLIAFTHDNDIYLLGEEFKVPEKITDSPDISKTEIALSYNKQKIAYLSGERIVIIDRNGTLLDETNPSRFSDFKDFGWSPDDETLYILEDDDLIFLGPPMEVPGFNVPFSDATLLSVDISPNLDVVFSYRRGNFVDDFNYLKINFTDPSKRDGSFQRTDRYHHVRISHDGTRILATKFTNEYNSRFQASNEGVVWSAGDQELTNLDFLWRSHAPDFLGTDTILFGRGSGNNFDGNILMGSAPEEAFISYLTLFEETSETIFMDWKP